MGNSTYTYVQRQGAWRVDVHASGASPKQESVNLTLRNNGVPLADLAACFGIGEELGLRDHSLSHPRSRWCLGRASASHVAVVAHLALEGLPHEPHHVGKFLERREANLRIPIPPSTESRDIATQTLRVADLGKSDVQR